MTHLRRCRRLRFHANFLSFFFTRRARNPLVVSEKTSLTTHHANAVLAMAHRHSLHWPLCCVVCTQDVCISSLFHFIFHVPRCVVLLAHSATLVHSLSQADCAHRMILHNFDLSYVIKHMVRKQMSCFRCHNHRAACFQWIRSFLCVRVSECFGDRCCIAAAKTLYLITTVSYLYA